MRLSIQSNQRLKELMKKIVKEKKEEFLKARLDYLLIKVFEDLKNGYKYPSESFIGEILRKSDLTTEDKISELITNTKDEAGVIIKKNKRLLTYKDNPYLMSNTSFVKLEREPYIKAFVLIAIQEMWDSIIKLSPLQRVGAAHYIRSLKNLRSKLHIVDSEVNSMLNILNPLSSIEENKPPTYFAFYKDFRLSILDSAGLAFKKKLIVTSCLLELFVSGNSGNSEKALSALKTRSSKSVKKTG